ncbi:MAG: hypothetical protein MMC33_010881, partial [Icmadophila ericetorum]|nr:hypothetical protein [Icmadophila ericetorum]
IYRIHERQSAACPNNTSNTYTALIGLSFDLYCGQYLLSETLPGGASIQDDMQACMEQCSTYSAFDNPCYGVSYAIDTGNCQLKDQSKAPFGNLTFNTTANSAIANPAQLITPNATCPFSPYSYQYTTKGMEFEILCNLDLPHGDYHPENVDYWPYHAGTLEECMELCANSRPLCVGIAWDLSTGYGNCYPKSSLPGTPYAHSNGYVTHSAIWRNDELNISCPVTATYTAGNDGKSFEVGCNSGRLGGSNTSYHDDSLDGCIGTCATNSSQDCLGIIYDGSLQDGWENCYLLNVTGKPTSVANSTFALFSPSDKDTNSTSAPLIPSPSLKGTSKAWVSAPVVGGILVTVLLTGLFFWWLRKRSAKATNRSAPGVSGYGPFEQSQSPYKDTHTPYELYVPPQELHGQGIDAAELPPNLAPHELGSSPDRSANKQPTAPSMIFKKL